MLACNRLRIDCGKSPVIEYRIEDGAIESREITLEKGESAETEWRRLSTEQITAHVMADTVVAHWLRRRIGLYSLLRLCAGDIASQADGTQNPEDRMAA